MSLPRFTKRLVFRADLLPTPAQYYAKELGLIQGETVTTCCFHLDKKASFEISPQTGAFFCHGCQIQGDSVVAFHRLRYHKSFLDSTQALGAWA